MIRNLSLVLSLLALVAAPAHSSPQQPDLKVGMYPHEVLRLWGAPTDKSELEGLREDIWSYLQGNEVRFKEGRVLEVRLSEKKGRLEGEDDTGSAPRASYRRIMHGVAPLSAKDVKELFEEVMRGADGEGTGLSVAAPNNIAAQPPGMPTTPMFSEPMLNDTMPFVE